MQTVRPTRPDDDSWEVCVYAEHQQDTYNPLPSVKNVDDPSVPVVSVWEPTPDEMIVLQKMIDDGRVRISLTQLTFGKKLQPVKMEIGVPIPGYAI